MYEYQEEHDDLCIINECNEIGCYRHTCQCDLIEKVEERYRAHVERERKEQEEQATLYATAKLIHEGDEVRVKIDDGDKIFGVVRGKAVLVGPRRTGVAVCGVTVLDPYAKRVSDGIKEISVIRMANESWL